MKVNVETVQTNLPEQEIVLTLTPVEFAMLEWLRFKHLGGSASVRTAIQAGFDNVLVALDSGWRSLVDEAREVRDGQMRDRWASEQIESIFRRASVRG